MKNLYKIVLLFFVIVVVSCNKSPQELSYENVDITYDSLLVKSTLMVSPQVKVAHLKEWLVDNKAAEGKENMLFFQNQNLSGMITIKAYHDANFENYLASVEPTFAGKELLSKSTFTFQNKIYHQFIIRSEEYIVLKAVIEIDDKTYVDTNVLVIESKYPEISQMIETYLASIAVLN